MIVLGIRIPSEVVTAVETRIAEGDFSCRDIAGVFACELRECGVRTDVADRAADRLLQLHRRRGTIRFVAGRWLLVEAPR